MKNSFSLFFLLLCVCIIPSNTALLSTIQTSHSSTYQSPSTQKQQPSRDEWLDFDDEDEEPATLQPKTRWQRFMGGVDKFALQMKALWAFKIKPWWQEKHGKEITIATASTLAALVATWMMYRRYRQQTNFLAHLKMTDARTSTVDLTNRSPVNKSSNKK